MTGKTVNPTKTEISERQSFRFGKSARNRAIKSALGRALKNLGPAGCQTKLIFHYLEIGLRKAGLIKDTETT